MRQVVNFVNVSEAGLESSPVAPALAGLRANEARYFKNKYDHDFAVAPAVEEAEAIGWVSRILSEYKFARQKSKLAGVIRGSYFVIKNDY